jgi:hypothetical protein
VTPEQLERALKKRPRTADYILRKCGYQKSSPLKQLPNPSLLEEAISHVDGHLRVYYWIPNDNPSLRRELLRLGLIPNITGGR